MIKCQDCKRLLIDCPGSCVYLPGEIICAQCEIARALKELDKEEKK